VSLGAERREQDALYIYSIRSTGNFRLVAGDTGIDLDGDGRRDLTYSESLPLIGVAIDPGFDGQRNHVSMAGDSATGDPVRIHTSVGLGEYTGQFSSRNTLIGGAGRDRIGGSSGDDRILGGGGDDSLIGGSGDDRILGGPGDDGMFGGRGQDHCSGGPGRDQAISCEVGPG
jgi:Ca2+-binding RTX toxin-like protein